MNINVTCMERIAGYCRRSNLIQTIFLQMIVTLYEHVIL